MYSLPSTSVRIGPAPLWAKTGTGSQPERGERVPEPTPPARWWAASSYSSADLVVVLVSLIRVPPAVRVVSMRRLARTPQRPRARRVRARRPAAHRREG